MNFPFENGGGGGPPAVTGASGPWQRLVSTVCESPVSLSGAALAERINANPASQYAGAVNLSLREILTERGAGAETGAGQTDRAASQLVTRLRPDILVSVLRAEAEPQRRRELLEGAILHLSIPASLRMASAVAVALERPLSPALRMIVRKLARAANGPDAEAAAWARTCLQELVRSITLEWTQPKKGGKGFEPATHRPQPRSAGRTTPEAERVVQVALECEAMGDAVTAAVHELVEAGETRLVIDMLAQVPETNQAGKVIVKQIATAEGLTEALLKEPPDTAAADVLLRGLGIAAAKVMIETLIESRSRPTRRYLLDRLAKLGPEVRPLAEGRLRDSRWFVLRNVVALFRAAGAPADPPTAERLLENEDVRVRRETLLWCLESPAMRERGMSVAIADGDAAMLRPALQAARTELPGAVVPVLARRLLQPDFPPEFRVPAIQLLGRSRSLLAVEALLHFVQNGTNLLGRTRLAPRSPEMLAALRALVRGWPQERRVQPIIEAARESRDTHVSRAVATAASGNDE